MSVLGEQGQSMLQEESINESSQIKSFSILFSKLITIFQFCVFIFSFIFFSSVDSTSTTFLFLWMMYFVSITVILVLNLVKAKSIIEHFVDRSLKFKRNIILSTLIQELVGLIFLYFVIISLHLALVNKIIISFYGTKLNISSIFLVILLAGALRYLFFLHPYFSMITGSVVLHKDIRVEKLNVYKYKSVQMFGIVPLLVLAFPIIDHNPFTKSYSILHLFLILISGISMLGQMILENKYYQSLLKDLSVQVKNNAPRPVLPSLSENSFPLLNTLGISQLGSGLRKSNQTRPTIKTIRPTFAQRPLEFFQSFSTSANRDESIPENPNYVSQPRVVKELEHVKKTIIDKIAAKILNERENPLKMKKDLGYSSFFDTDPLIKTESFDSLNQVFCVECGSKLPTEYSFCNICGNQLKL